MEESSPTRRSTQRVTSRSPILCQAAQRTRARERPSRSMEPNPSTTRPSRSRSPSKSSRRKRRRSPSTSSSSEREQSRSMKKKKKQPDEDSAFINKFMTMISSLQKIGNNDKLPLTNNVLPEFDPMSKEQTIDAWIGKIEECAQIYGWDDRHKIHYALPKLSGVAKVWYQGLPSLLFTWSEWKEKLKESFPSYENYADLLSEMLSKRAKYGDRLDLLLL